MELMNNHEPQLELARRCLDEEVTAEEFANLERLLQDDPEFRKEYLQYMFVDSVLAGGIANFSEQPPKPGRSASSPASLFPKKWNPVATAAAAGMIIGLFCASVAWAIIAPRDPGARLVIPVVSESFENPHPQIIGGFPAEVGIWAGDKSSISGVVSGYLPVDGEAMLSLETALDSNLGYLQQIVDVSDLPQAADGEMRYFESETSFLTIRSSERDRYTVRVATFKEPPGEIRNLWENMSWREIEKSSLTAVKSAIATRPGTDGWRRVLAAVNLPENARTVVISLAAGRLDPEAPKIPHYIDDVRADVVIGPVRKRNKRRTSKPR